MFKLLGISLFAGLLVTSCGEQVSNQAQNKNLNQNQNQNQRQSNVAATTEANATRPASTPSPTQTAPMTASIKNAGNTWKDDVSSSPVTTIKVGGTVTWTITSGTHSIERVAPSTGNGCDELDDKFDSETLTSGKSVTRTFTKAGTFGYHCGIHMGDPDCKNPPGTGRMPGVVKVVP